MKHSLDIHTRALRELDQEIGDRLGIRPLSERREKLDKMYRMICNLCETAISGERCAIVGEGFYINATCEGAIVFRRGEPLENVPLRVTTIAPMFTPEMFFEGVTTQEALARKAG